MEQLTRFGEAADEALAAFEAGDEETALARIDEAKKSHRTMKRGLAPFDPAQPERPGVRLQAVASRPLWDALSPLEVGFMVLWALVLTWPVWNPLLNTLLLLRNRERIRRWRKVKLLGMLGLFVGASLGGS